MLTYESYGRSPNAVGGMTVVGGFNTMSSSYPTVCELRIYERYDSKSEQVTNDRKKERCKAKAVICVGSFTLCKARIPSFSYAPNEQEIWFIHMYQS